MKFSFLGDFLPCFKPKANPFGYKLSYLGTMHMIETSDIERGPLYKWPTTFRNVHRHQHIVGPDVSLLNLPSILRSVDCPLPELPKSRKNFSSTFEPRKMYQLNGNRMSTKYLLLTSTSFNKHHPEPKCGTYHVPSLHKCSNSL